MDLQEYQNFVARSKIYATKEAIERLVERFGPGFLSSIMNLPEEAGEVSQVVVKVLQDKKGEVDAETRKRLREELGDVLWDLTMVARYLGYTLEEIAEENFVKLSAREKEGKTKNG